MWGSETTSGQMDLTMANLNLWPEAGRHSRHVREYRWLLSVTRCSWAMARKSTGPVISAQVTEKALVSEAGIRLESCWNQACHFIRFRDSLWHESSARSEAISRNGATRLNLRFGGCLRMIRFYVPRLKSSWRGLGCQSEFRRQAAARRKSAPARGR